MEMKEVTRREVEAKLASVGDYVKIDYLTRVLKMNIDFDTKKFALSKLSSIYESKNMYAEAGRMMVGSAEINATFQGKVEDFVRAANLFVKAGNYEDAESAFAKASATGNEMEKRRIKSAKKDLYLRNAREMLSRDKRKNAMVAYEKTLNYVTDLSMDEKKECQITLLALYEKLGRIREFYALQRALNPNTVVGNQKTAQEPNKFRNTSFRDNPEPPKRQQRNEVAGNDISIDELIG